MKQTLDEETRKAVVDYRLARSRETLAEVDYLIAGRFYSTAVCRLYYACYYSAVALLVANGLEAQTHAGVKTMLSFNFVKKGILDRHHAKTFFKLFDLRMNNDYDDFSFCDKETLDEMRPLAEDFINAVTMLIEK